LKTILSHTSEIASIPLARRSNAAVFVVAVVASIAAAIPAVGQAPVSFSETFYSYGNSVTVNFRAWVPPDLDRVRGIVFSIPGTGGDTRNITTNGSWRGKLTGMGFAILGVQYTTVPTGGDVYWGAGGEEITANMLNMIDGMADALGRPEIVNAPMIIEGVSHGGFATNDIVQSIPERVLGYVEDKGTTYLWADPAKHAAISQVPGLLVLAETDDAVPPPNVYESFKSLRQINGRVAEEVDWTGHQNTHPDTKFAFVDQVYRLRYPHGQVPSLEPGNLLAPVELPLSSGWVGEVNPVGSIFDPYVLPIEWPEIMPEDEHEYVYGPEEVSWLPNEAMAMVYRAHNAVPAGIGRTALAIEVVNDADRNVNGGAPVDLGISLSEIVYTGIDVYHEDELIAQLDYSSGTQHVFYTPTETGIHTFVAVASYEYSGETHYTSKYTTVGVAFISSAIAGDYNDDGVVDAADYTVWRDMLGQTGLGLAADGTGPLGPPDGVVNELDYSLWNAHFGQAVSGSGAGAYDSALHRVFHAAVPEPSSLVLALVGTWAMLCRQGMAASRRCGGRNRRRRRLPHRTGAGFTTQYPQLIS
jgi:hypothetical protein